MEESASSGLSGSIRRLVRTLLGLLHNRVELFAVELQEEQRWLVTMLMWAAVVVFLATAALTTLTVLILLLTPPGARVFVLLGFLLVFAGLAVWAVGRLRLQFQDRTPFAASLKEIEKDIQRLRADE